MTSSQKKDQFDKEAQTLKWSGQIYAGSVVRKMKFNQYKIKILYFSRGTNTNGEYLGRHQYSRGEF